jgi:hypothetical protein
MVVTPLNVLEKLLKEALEPDHKHKEPPCSWVEFPYEDKKNFLGLAE